VPPALGAALGASFGFMLPISTPPNAIVYGSGLVPLREMVRAGALLDLAGAAIIWLSLRLLCPLLGGAVSATPPPTELGDEAILADGPELLDPPLGLGRVRGDVVDPRSRKIWSPAAESRGASGVA
jgi:sodium:sulfate symporter-like transmembrane protein